MIIYKIKTADSISIQAHLIQCKDSFIPGLDTRVDLKEYSGKLFEHSITFEAWDGADLAGLIAAYFNDIKGERGYITSVSIIESYLGMGIAKELMINCVKYAKEKQFREIYLEVNIKSKSAISLYEKFGFTIYERDGEFLKMNLTL